MPEKSKNQTSIVVDCNYTHYNCRRKTKKKKKKKPNMITFDTSSKENN